MAFIKIENLYKIFGPRPKEIVKSLKQGATKAEVLKNDKHTVALQDISLEIDKGETFVIMGLSGSGKSTLVRCLNRLIDPNAGRILVDGKDVVSLNEKELQDFRRHTMNMVFQRFGLLPHRTVLDNVAFGLEVCGIEREEREKEAYRWLDIVGLKGWEISYPHELSGGMQQRVGLARALCSDPEVLLMDEPFSALDPLIRRQMQNELIELAAKIKKTIIFITHDLDEALRLGDRIAILKDGRLIQVGLPEEILLNPADDYVMDFTQDVNLSRVLTAGTAMITPYAIVSDRNGPRAAIEAMRRDNHSSVFIVNRENVIQGLITIEKAIEARQQGIRSLREIQLEKVNTTSPEVALEELYPMLAETKWPVVVTNEESHLLGIVPRVAILEALARSEN